MPTSSEESDRELDDGLDVSSCRGPWLGGGTSQHHVRPATHLHRDACIGI